MARKCWIQINGELIDKEDHEAIAKARGYSLGTSSVAIVPDMPDFVSPIDGKVYSGRAGMREHCKTHNVVSNLELKGLPTYQSNVDHRSESQRRADNASRKERIIHQVNKYF